MREQPPAKLIALLERLGLATAGHVGRVEGRVRRLARNLPRFESVWVDALAQTRILTPWQAAEINAGRGETLRIGPYLACGRLEWPDYVDSYRARRLRSGEPARLAVIDNAAGRTEGILSRLEALVAGGRKLRCENLAPLTEAGPDGQRIWTASRWVEGRSAAKWMVHNGRFPAEVVLEIARAMLAGLVELEAAGLCHGDLNASALMLTDGGDVVLLQPGLRGIVRPEEGYAHADLRPEAYDCLAPERISEGTGPTMASDVYACGCVWWHLLCGRSPVAGGDSLGKLRAAQAAEVFDVRRLAPEVPAALASAISACLRREPSRRPESMARLAAMLGGPTTRRGRLAPARQLVVGSRRYAVGGTGGWRLTGTEAQLWSARPQAPRWLAVLAGCLAVAAAILWAVWNGRPPSPLGRGGPRELSAAEVPGSGGDRKDGFAAAEENLADPQCPVVRDLVLASGGPLEIESLSLRPGQCVRGMPGKRPVLMVPRTGLVVGAEDVRFEKIEFVWDHPAQAEAATARQAAIVHLCSARAAFLGCLFQSARRLSTPPVAIRWTHPADREDSEFSLPSGRIQLTDCVLRGVDAGVDCRTLGALAVELTNTLQLGSGPLVRLDHCPKPDEPVLISLGEVTLRGAGPVLECGSRGSEERPGEISIRAARCAFVPEPNAALLLFGGPEPPERKLRSIRWTGQGSLVSPETPIAAWRRPDGVQQVLDEAGVSIAGLVRSEVGFAGSADAGTAASRIVRWRVPLRSTDPPGIDPAALPRNATTTDGP